MENKTCCCFGHREVYKDISARLHEIIKDLIINKGVKTFYTGGMGQFDGKFASAIRALQKSYPEIEIVLICPYLKQELNTYKEWYEHNYDSILIPSELDGIHYKAAIKARNRWMVDNSDYIVSYVYREFGGAYDAVQYAKRQGKEIYNTIEK